MPTTRQRQVGRNNGLTVVVQRDVIGPLRYSVQRSALRHGRSTFDSSHRPRRTSEPSSAGKSPSIIALPRDRPSPPLRGGPIATQARLGSSDSVCFCARQSTGFDATFCCAATGLVHFFATNGRSWLVTERHRGSRLQAASGRGCRVGPGNFTPSLSQIRT